MVRSVVALWLPGWLAVCASVGFGSFLAAADVAPAAVNNAVTVKPLRVLLVCGGCCHDYAAQKELLSKGLMERAHVEVTVVHQGGSTTNTKIPLYENENWAEGYDVVIHDECFADVKEAPFVERILKPHREGLPGVVLHCAMHCYRTGDDAWFKFCGVVSRQHGKQYPHEVLTRDATHPIMQGTGPGWYNPAGELYWIERVLSSAQPLASAKNQENGRDEVCAWTNEFGKGRVFGTTLGHHNETVNNPHYLDLVTRGTLWAAGKLEPAYLKPKVARQVPVNLALKKPVAASSEESTKQNFAKKAVDGDSQSRWCANGAGGPQWLNIDLQKPQELRGCRLVWEASDAVYKYKVEASADQQKWQLLVDGSENTKAGDSVHEFTTKDMRYVRVTFLSSSTGAWGSLKEVEVFGTELVTIDVKDDASDKELALLKEVKVPAGFTAKIFATPPTVNYPVYVAATPGGDIFVSSDKNGSLGREPRRGSVLRVRDVDGDGRADEVKRFVADVDSPRGLVFDHDRVYLMHPPHLSAFIDKDGDGISDEQKILVKNIAFTFKDRPADHTSNGVTLGIDGWLYLAIGDFGFMQAEGADGTKLQLRGGGVVRVRPDGTGLEVYSRGTRNILEVGVDPLLNGFSRDNTNDGGGWDIRLHHFSGLEHHGYPSLYKNFSDELVQPLADYGGGSGCGALYMDEPGFPPGYGNAMYTADWGRQIVFRHQMTAAGATFKADQTEFASVTRVTDLDVDGLSRMMLASWKGAVFNYADENVGYLVRVVPTGYTPEALPDFEKLSQADLAKQLQSPSHRRRLEAQRTLLRKTLEPATVTLVQQMVTDGKQPLACRIAALFTLKQGQGTACTPFLLKLTADPTLQEYALRALTDRRDQLAGVPAEPFLQALTSSEPRVRRQAAASIARLGNDSAATGLTALLADPDALVNHTAIEALIAMQAAPAAFAVIDSTPISGPARAGAVRVLQALHTPEVVDGLLTRLQTETDPLRRQGLLVALCRLSYREGPWAGNSWGTRPDTTGPYYQPEKWEATDKIAAALKAVLSKANAVEASFLIPELSRHKLQLDGSLETILALASKDATLIPAAVTQLNRAPSVPATAVPLLVQAATAADSAATVRSQAVVTLGKVDSPASVQAMFSGLAQLESTKQAQRELELARDAFVGSGALGNQVHVCETQAAKLAGNESKWADVALLVLSTAKSASPEAKEQAAKSLDAGWANPQRKLQILEAIAISKQAGAADKVLAALSDTDAKVAAAAKKAADILKLNRPAGSTGPAIEKLKVEDVVAAVLKQKGDRELGEQLFVRLSCVKCHTTKPDEMVRGPFLGNIANTYKRKELAEAVLIPSKTIAQGFVTNQFIMDDGKVFTGFVVQEAADKVTIRDIEGREQQLVVANIEERLKQPISMMPEGLVKVATVYELASLLDFLESLAKK